MVLSYSLSLSLSLSIYVLITISMFYFPSSHEYLGQGGGILLVMLLDGLTILGLMGGVSRKAILICQSSDCFKPLRFLYSTNVPSVVTYF